MKRKILIWSLLTLLLFCLTYSGIPVKSHLPFQEIFGKKYQRALNVIKANESIIKKNLDRDSIHFKLLTAIIFPELIRYTPTRDKLEQESLDILYVEYGAEDGLDFSIGLFQMRPSFVEKLENHIQNKEKYFSKEYQFFEDLYTYTQAKGKEERQERVNRLKDISWQTKYLRCFYHILEDKFCISDLPINERVVFAATAYNRGFHCTMEEIKKWEKIENFPFGKSF